MTPKASTPSRNTTKAQFQAQPRKVGDPNGRRSTVTAGSASKV